MELSRTNVEYGFPTSFLTSRTTGPGGRASAPRRGSPASTGPVESLPCVRGVPVACRPRRVQRLVRRLLRGGDTEHLLDVRELDPGPAGRLAQGALVPVDLAPALVGDQIGPALLEHLVDALGVGGIRVVQQAGVDVPQDRVDRLLRILLVRSDHAGGAALDPADGVLAEAALPIGADHSASLICDHRPALVEGNSWQRLAPVADRPQKPPRGARLRLCRLAR